MGGDALDQVRTSLDDPTLESLSETEKVREKFDFCLEDKGYGVDAAAAHREDSSAVPIGREERKALAATERRLDAIELGWAEGRRAVDVAMLTGRGEIKVWSKISNFDQTSLHKSQFVMNKYGKLVIIIIIINEMKGPFYILVKIISGSAVV